MDTLGHISWYTIRETTLSRQEIIDRLNAAGLSSRFAPAPIKPSDAFRRATSEIEARKIPRGDGTFVNLLVREVSSDRKEVVRHLVREVVDAQNRRLSYEQVASITLDKSSNMPGYWAFQGLTHEEGEALRNAMKRYDLYQDAYQGRHLREIVYDVLQSLSPVAVRPSGGVYFVPEEHTEALQQLAAFTRSLGECEMWTMPVSNDGAARQVISHSLDQEVEDAAERLVAQVRQALLRKGEVSEAEQRHALEELHRLQEITTRYEGLLEEKLTQAQANLEAATRQIRSLLVA